MEHRRQRPVACTPMQVKFRILLIDDCADTVRLLQAYLADPGIELTVARNGRDGIEAFQRAAEPFHLVLMDMEMPILDGYAATAEIRRWETEGRLPQTPIAALTALSDMASAARTMAAGCAIHLTKPVLRQTLLEVVREYGAPRIPPPERLSNFIATCRSELVCLVGAVKLWDLASIARTGGRLRSLGEDCGLPAICEIGISLEEAPNLDAALYGVERLRCCLGALGQSGIHLGPELAVSDFDESIETLVIRELMPEYIASMQGKIILLVTYDGSVSPPAVTT